MLLLERAHDPTMLARGIDLTRVHIDVSPVKTACAPEPIWPPYLISGKWLPTLWSLPPLTWRVLTSIIGPTLLSLLTATTPSLTMSSASVVMLIPLVTLNIASLPLLCHLSLDLAVERVIR